MPVLTLGNADLRVFRGGALLEDLHSCRGLPTTWRVERIEAVKTWPEPKSVGDIQVLVGFATFCRPFIQRFSKIAAPLTSMLKTRRSMVIDDEAIGGGGRAIRKSAKSTNIRKIGWTENFFYFFLVGVITPDARIAFTRLRQAFNQRFYSQSKANAMDFIDALLRYPQRSLSEEEDLGAESTRILSLLQTSLTNASLLAISTSHSSLTPIPTPSSHLRNAGSV